MSPIRILLLLTLGWGVLGCAKAQPPATPVKLEIRRAEKTPAEGLTEAAIDGTDDKIYLHGVAELTNGDVAYAEASSDSNGEPVVQITFTRDGAAKMTKLTAEHMEKPLAVLIDGQVITAPVVVSVISDAALISGRFTRAEVEDIARGIDAGR